MAECILQLSISVNRAAVLKQPDLYESIGDDEATTRTRDAMIGAA